MALILASTSPIRRQMLEAAGVCFEVVPPNVDEVAVKAGFSGDDASLARSLAEAKAMAVSRTIGTEQWVIGSDSVISVGGRRFSKPNNKEDALEHLRAFRGKTMELTSAAALARGGRVEWSCAQSAQLHVRDLSDRFISEYLEAEWPDVNYCVGVFRMEGRGAQLFSAIEGDHFTILGMPLLSLLGALRERGILAS